MNCEIFDYGQEEFDTGIDGLDDLDDQLDLSDDTIFDQQHPDAQEIEDLADAFKEPDSDSDLWGDF